MRADPAREQRELEEYLGPAFELERLQRHEQATREEWHEVGDAERFYRTSRSYLYDLTAFAMTGTKEPYHAALRRLVRPGARILDYGCGIGSDGLRLLDDGYDVTFADFANPSTAYLAWRLERRGHGDGAGRIVDLDALPDGVGGFDLAFAFDVLEHAEDPPAVQRTLEGLADVVLVNLLDTDGDDLELHRPMPLRPMLHRAAPGLVLHERHHERSHLVAYRPDATAGRWRTALRRMRIDRRIR
ncbi:MAG: class I SAM-dependent methyltransferase [Solirubrobacteraceae bacterium]